MRRIAARVTGRVQGVFFRDSTRRRAIELGLTGWVRNELDGSVRSEAQGADQQIDDFVAGLQVGPSQARVAHVDLTGMEPLEDEHGFAIG